MAIRTSTGTRTGTTTGTPGAATAPTGADGPIPGHHLHVGRFVHLPGPVAGEIQRPAVDRRRRAAGLIGGFAELGASQTVLGPQVGELPPPTPGVRRVVRPAAPGWPPRWSVPHRGWLPDVALRTSSIAELVGRGIRATVHVHLQELDDLPVAAIAAVSRIGPLVVHLGGSASTPLRHGGTATVRSRLVGGPTERWLLRGATLVVAHSARLAEVASDLGARRVVTVPDAPPPRPADLPEALSRPWPERRGRRLVAIGPLVPRRRSTALVACLASLPTDVELVLIGTGPDRLPVDRAVRHHGLTGRVHVVPSATRAQVAAHLHHADAVVSASLAGDDTTPLLQAMAAGRPVVATAVEDVPLHLTDGIDGRLVPAADTAALTTAVRRMLRHPAEAAAMGASASRRARAAGWSLAASQVLEALASTTVPGEETGSPGAANPHRTNTSGAIPPTHTPIAP